MMVRKPVPRYDIRIIFYDYNISKHEKPILPFQRPVYSRAQSFSKAQNRHSQNEVAPSGFNSSGFEMFMIRIDEEYIFVCYCVIYISLKAYFIYFSLIQIHF